VRVIPEGMQGSTCASPIGTSGQDNARRMGKRGALGKTSGEGTREDHGGHPGKERGPCVQTNGIQSTGQAAASRKSQGEGEHSGRQAARGLGKTTGAIQQKNGAHA
jgi:hypothetical protein